MFTRHIAFFMIIQMLSDIPGVQTEYNSDIRRPEPPSMRSDEGSLIDILDKKFIKRDEYTLSDEIT